MSVKLEIKGNFLYATNNSTNEIKRLIRRDVSFDYVRLDKFLSLKVENGTNQVSYDYSIYEVNGDVAILDETDTPFVDLDALEDFLINNIGSASVSEVQTLVDHQSKSPTQEVLTTDTTFTAGTISFISFDVINGTVDVTIGSGSPVTYPLDNCTTGYNELESLGGFSDDIVFEPSVDSSVLVIYK